MADELYPVFLKLGGRRVVVVGGGQMAAAKVQGLLPTGARITVVAPLVRPEIAEAGVVVVRREFAPADLDEAVLAVAAATPEVNRQVSRAGEERRVFVNAVDHPDVCSAFAAGIVRRGGVTLAVSTSGLAPALAGLLREALEAVLPEDLHAWVGTAHALRERQRAEGVPMAERRPVLLHALNALYAEKAHP
jgi:uroporphyrin-III C-methyltransferase / precorrin-2 dehydrogenase / sirohydrochlorin ferrochelatase